MMEPDRRIYVKHILNNRCEIIAEIQQAAINKDRYYMQKILKSCIEYFDEHHIDKYQHFIELLKKIKLKTNDIRHFIMNFSDFINSYEQKNIKPITWIISRSVVKSNFTEKNIILNRFAHEYPKELIYFTQQYIMNNFPNTMNLNIFFNEFENKIKELYKIKEETNKLAFSSQGNLK